MKINGREYVLSQRRAVDVLNLAAAVEKRGDDTNNITNVLTMAQVVCDSLKATGLDLGRVRGWRYRPFVQGKTSLLIESLSTQQIIEAYMMIVCEIEGGKKKVQEMAR